MVSLGRSYFGVIDYVAVGLTLLISLAIGIYHAVKGRGKETNEDLLMGGRKMKALPIAASMLVTYFSAIAIIGIKMIFQNKQAIPFNFTYEFSRLSRRNLCKWV